MAATSATNAWAVGTATGGKSLMVHWNGTSWTRVSSPGGTLSGVAATSARNVWAVGSSAGKTLILHWTGASWKRVASPNPGSNASLSSVVATSASNAWAVGTIGYAKTLILHWNGSSWKQVASPTPGSGGQLYGVDAFSARSAWAVGTYSNPKTFAGATLILHWNGSTWSRQASPSPVGNGNGLTGVVAISAHNAWSVGCASCGIGGFSNSLTLHSGGTSWQTVSSRRPAGGDLGAVAAVSSRDIWAVGSYYSVTFESQSLKTLTLRWNGTSWQQVAAPSPGAEADLSGVAAVSARDAWAVGSYQTVAGSGASTKTLILHWKGTSWS